MATGFNTQVSNGEYRLQFETDNREYYLLMQSTARRCVDGKPVTNADRIRAMRDEELAAWIASMATVCECCAEINECESPKCFNKCLHGVEGWLQQPADNDKNGV